MKLHETTTVERAVLAQVIEVRRDPSEAADSLAELARLADTAGICVAGQVTQRRQRPDGGTLFGEGKVRELGEALQAASANIVLFDNELTAIQAHNLGKVLGARVMDRTEVIYRFLPGGPVLRKRRCRLNWPSCSFCSRAFRRPRSSKGSKAASA